MLVVAIHNVNANGKLIRRDLVKIARNPLPTPPRITTKLGGRKWDYHMGGKEWCTTHKFGTHYDHMCRRHAPNYPNAPKIVRVDVAKTEPTSEIAARVASLLGIPASQKSGVKQPNSVRITPAESSNFQMARNASANIATDGPPASISHIMNKILSMNKLDRQLLTSRLAKTGL